MAKKQGEMRMTPDREEKIRKRAYEKWEREGSPEGREKEHWAEAERDLGDESSPAAAPGSGTSTKPGSAPPPIADKPKR